MSELKEIAANLARKQELVKDLIEQNERVQELKAQIKELQDELKAVIAADAEIVSLQDDVKCISKELKEAAKKIAKNTSFKTSMVVAFAKAAAKSDEAVSAVKVKGNAFSFLESEIN